MIKCGIDINRMMAIPDQGSSRGMRTYQSAVAIRKELQKKYGHLKSADVFTHASHGRESLVLFKKAFGNELKVGVISAKPQLFDAEHWWMSKAGWWMVMKGATGYVYAELFVLFRQDF